MSLFTRNAHERHLDPPDDGTFDCPYCGDIVFPDSNGDGMCGTCQHRFTADDGFDPDRERELREERRRDREEAGW